MTTGLEPRRKTGVKKRITQTIGLDLGDKTSTFCVLDEATGDVIERGEVRTDQVMMELFFACRPAARVVMEVGCHSPWVSRIAERYCAKVYVANSRRLKFIYANERKSDVVDAEALARVGRMDARLLMPVRHRGPKAQKDLALIRCRAQLIETRTELVSSLRGQIKAQGARLPSMDAASIGFRTQERLPLELRDLFKPVLLAIESVTDSIHEYDERIEAVAKKDYPEIDLLTQVWGVATLTALTFVLTLEDPDRFLRSRTVGAFLGLVPGRDQSGAVDKEKRITKRGDSYLRTLLIQCAGVILMKHAPDTDLKRHGERIARDGSKVSKRKAKVAVARKLAVLLLTLWRRGEEYESLRNRQAA